MSKYESYILTHSNKRLYPFNIKEDQIDIYDIAVSLSRLPRWTGHSNGVRAYSVAQHSCYVSRLVFNETGDRLQALTGLLHDASEAYCGDLATPIKKFLPDYSELENNIQQAIATKYKLIWPFPDAVHRADKIALGIEAAHMFYDHPCAQHFQDCCDTYTWWDEDQAYNNFKLMFEKLKND